MTAARCAEGAAPVSTVTELRRELRGLAGRKLPARASLAVVLASAHGAGDVDPVENLLGEVQLLSASSLWILGNALEEADEDSVARKVFDHLWQTLQNIERKAAAAEALLSLESAEEASAGGISPFVKRTPPAARRRDPEGGEAERQLAMHLDRGAAEAEEAYRGMGSVSPHFAPIGRLLALIRTMLAESGDEHAGSPSMVKALHEAGTVLEFELADWRAAKPAGALR